MVHCLNHLPTLMGVARDGRTVWAAAGRALQADIAANIFHQGSAGTHAK